MPVGGRDKRLRSGGMGDPSFIMATLPLLGSINVWIWKVDYICIGPEVGTSILDHHSEPPALVWLKGLSEFLSGQRATIDDHVVGPADSAVLAVDQPPSDLLVSDNPP
jgi:hypothetical protein